MHPDNDIPPVPTAKSPMNNTNSAAGVIGGDRLLTIGEDKDEDFMH